MASNPKKEKHSEHSEHAPKRKHIRFKPDPLDVAFVAFNQNVSEFQPDMAALIIEEAPLGGCGLVIRFTEKLQVGDKCAVKVGRLSPLKAEVSWRKPLDNQVLRMGFKFLE